MFVAKILGTMFPSAYQYIWSAGWLVGKKTGASIAHQNAEDRLIRFALDGLDNQEFQLGYAHAKKIALNQLVTKDFPEPIGEETDD